MNETMLSANGQSTNDIDSTWLQAAARREKFKRLRFAGLLTAALAVIFFFFLRIVKLGFYGQKVFDLNGLKLLFFNLQVGEHLIAVPLLTRLLLALCLLCAVGAILFLIIKRSYLFYGILMFCSAICALGGYMSLQLLNNTVSTISGLGALVYIPGTGFYGIFIIGLVAAAIGFWCWNYERLFAGALYLFAGISIVSVAAITGFMLFMGLPAIMEIGLFDFLFGTTWAPTAGSPSFGIGAMILTSVYATAGAILVGAPIGILTAVFMAELAPRPIAKILRPAIDLLAGVPSVIYGFFGLTVIVPTVRNFFHVKVGDGLFSVIIILCIMILPTVISVSETSLRAVPSHLKEASLALGATHIQSIFKVVIPAAKSGIFAGLILGVGRAVGETMAVLMVAGNVVNMPELFVPVRPMTTGIVMEMAYSEGLHRQALFAIGLVLFVFIMLINLFFRLLMRKAAQKDER